MEQFIPDQLVAEREFQLLSLLSEGPWPRLCTRRDGLGVEPDSAEGLTAQPWVMRLRGGGPISPASILLTSKSVPFPLVSDLK